MPQRDTSPAAFPRPASEFTKNGTLPDGNDAEDAQEGMSLRDYFAAKAMQSVMESADRGEAAGGPKAVSFDALAKSVAMAAYEFADAMLAARKL